MEPTSVPIRTDEPTRDVAARRRSKGALAAGEPVVSQLPESERLVEGPSHGDVVVGTNGPASRRFTLRQVPGDAQLSLASREAAVACACHFASFHTVDAWMDEGQGLTRLVRRRSRG